MFNSKRHMKNKCFRFFAAVLSTGALCSGVLFSGSVATVFAAEDAEQRLEAHRAMPIESNQIPNWPSGPVVGAESAILMEAETGTILYSKNIHERQYPASTTKILTALLAAEMCEMDEIVHFSHDAVFGTPRDSSHIAMDVGQTLTMEQALNAILIRSANEVSYAIAEHITGTTQWQDFGDIMNAKAEELGCLNSHFANPNGLPDENHYTTAYDLAMIGNAFFANEMLSKITLTRRLEIPASDTLPEGKLELNMMSLIPGGEYAYEYLVGCKTGYTSDARSCLVSCAEKNGLKLICVVMRDEAPYQYEDTIALFDYGFANFEKVNVSQTETKFNIDNTGLFYSGNDIFGSSQPILSLNKDDVIILPRTVSFEDTESTISYETENENQAAVISYTYHGVDIGSVRVNFAVDKEDTYIFDTLPDEALAPEEEQESPLIYINITVILIGLGVIAVILIVVLLVRAFLKNYAFSGRSGRRRRRKNTKWRQEATKRANRFRDYDF